MNLKIALKLRDLLAGDGLQVVLTRDADRRAINPLPLGPGQREGSTTADLQARIDIANQAQADVFISIHNNGSSDSGQSGTEVWYDARRPFSAFNRALAEQMLVSLVGAIRGVGHPVVNRGLKEDSYFRVHNGIAYTILVLGPPRSGAVNTRATQMPAILGETLFLSNPGEAALLARDDVRNAIAGGYREGLLRYFKMIDDGVLAAPGAGWPAEAAVSYS